MEELEVCTMKFETDQKKNDDSFLCASFDLQKVRNTPCGKSMLLYYSREISVYNFTVYESGTKDGFCYIWDKTNGKKGSNEICKGLNKYLKNLDDKKPKIKSIALYADNCSGQNKNKQIIAMIHKFLKKAKNIRYNNELSYCWTHLHASRLYALYHRVIHIK